MEEEAEKIKQMQNEVEKMAHSSSSKHFLFHLSGYIVKLFFKQKWCRSAKYHDLSVNVMDTH